MLKANLASEAIISGIKTLGRAVSSLGRSIVENYAEYEQLVGGVETLFGESANVVMEYANNAFQTAGLSANQYMETVTSFSASLLQSLGGDTAEAARVADLAITDMADNANKMGTSMEMIQNAYQGFAKANYTMLDNLKLGYGGTKEEMERLLADAEAISGIEYDISSYADIVEAIHVIQDEMGIAGATAEEASTTISGSIASMKAAWQNLVTSLSGGAGDMETALDQFIASAETAAGNLVPVIFNALNGIAGLIDRLAPLIIEKLPELVETLLPQLLEAAGSIVIALVEALPGLLVAISVAVMEFLGEIYTQIVNSAPQWLDSAKNLLDKFLSGLREGFTIIYESMAGFINDNIIQPIKAKAEEFIDAGKEIIENVKEGIRKAWESLTTWFSGLWDGLFGGLTANVHVNRTVSTTEVDGSHARGLDYVPFNGYIAELHRGEAVLTAAEAEDYRSGATRTNAVNVVQNIYSQAKTAADLMQEALYAQERAVFMGV